MADKQDVIEIDVLELMRHCLKRWKQFVLSILLAAVAGLTVCTFLLTPQYESTTKIIVLMKQQSGSMNYSDMQLAGQLTKDYEKLITGRDVLEAVIARCGLDDSYEELLKRTSVKNETDTRIISVTVEDPSPLKAQEIATSIRETAAEHIRNVTDVEAVNVAEMANLPEKPSSPSVKLWLILSAGAGFLFVLILSVVRFLQDDTVKTEEDITKYLEMSTLALIPKLDDAGMSRKKKSKNTSAMRRRIH
mgnify:CR=1 FL=1